MSVIVEALGLVFQPYVLLVILGSACFGMFVGAIPGLTATMATALLVPITFFMDPVPAIAAIVTATAMAIFAGDIPGAMLRMPGTPASAAYVEDAYRMTRSGRSEEALGAALVFSSIGGIFGTIVLVTASPALAEVALKFSSFEYFWLVVLGLSCAIFVSPGSVTRGIISLLIGLFAATVGIDNPAGEPRYTFGNVELLAGVQFIPAMIGLFAVSEVLRSVVARVARPAIARSSGDGVFLSQWKNFKRYPVQVFRGSAFGTAIGALPGAGADIAAWISYAVSKRFSKTPEKFGTGHVEGLVESGASNNGAVSGAWIPALVFGIPGDSITAIVIGVLYIKGINPGPTVFINDPQLIYAVFIVFFLANIIMLPLGWVAIKSAGTILSIPERVLMPIILMFCIVGSFAINNSIFGVILMLIFGILGFLMDENDIPIAPAILGLVLGPMLEQNFITSMIKADGSFLAFFERPIAAGLGLFTIAIWCLPLIMMMLMRRKKGSARPEPAAGD
ncbi:MAG: tripartite tricarboxylate transporter permease [Aurantimonas coralicida]|jgi:putative tricarboxylic transport membrane protein|uniref:TTT family tricarboxylate transporter, membrane protein n=2 Tax=Hyphomicrobiales TaxID=356 RepID=A0A0P0YYS3_9HYPH|nr:MULTISPECIES: tripartite tricarboxylate transporter permease [Aurantimonas]MCW7544071.1 tripartite tricarboxylate transporter permease [Aurantimonas litoralis]MBC6717853.1 tripartite tricarboxylate transporter permease [Aurantimonas sp. DM33-3]MCC4297763.1 tripartite tricarboxylate transporter permease [Aurantimonas coralicida]MDE0922751.1 tripartite tricarboxylate transporter permease [Aurantimonas coralicida]BAT26758.1 TTT family tricarboxylate transporter, membrane protein [Aurantimonas 